MDCTYTGPARKIFTIKIKVKTTSQTMEPKSEGTLLLLTQKYKSKSRQAQEFLR